MVLTTSAKTAEITHKIQNEHAGTPSSGVGIGALILGTSGLIPAAAILQLLLILTISAVIGLHLYRSGNIFFCSHMISQPLIGSGTGDPRHRYGTYPEISVQVPEYFLLSVGKEQSWKSVP